MKNIPLQSVLVLIILTVSMYHVSATAATTSSFEIPQQAVRSATITAGDGQDFDPLCDVQVTFELKTIRSLERTQYQTGVNKKIDALSDPDFYVTVTINDSKFQSPVYKNTKYVYDANWTVTVDVPDDQEFVTLDIRLWDWNIGLDTACDISSIYDDTFFRNYDVRISYSIATGTWNGDDFVNSEQWQIDPSGYGRVNGCDDRSYYDRERDCELWFDVYQTDPDGDGIPYWTEVNVLGTDPTVDNTGWDGDHDGCPIEWETKWGHQMYFDHQTNTTYHWWIYDPIGPDNHSTLDPDHDGLENTEEYLTSQWGSDPFRPDLFVELDQMEKGSLGRMVQFPENSKEMLNTAYDTRNIVFHLDDGCMGGGESIPFTSETLTRDNLTMLYYQYFLHGDLHNWRAGVFHYALNLYDAGWAGYVFDNGYTGHLDSLQISSKYHEQYTFKNPLYNTLRRSTLNIREQRELVYATALMHELGHTLGIFHGNTPGCDEGRSVNPWRFYYWKYGPYKSVMNYRYIYSGLVDYSDGSRGKNDFNDWGNLDLTFFQN
jgi:hypothetical protein